MSFLVSIGEKLYEFEDRSGVYKARAQYVKPECRSQDDLETFLEDSSIDFYVVDPETLDKGYL